MKQIFTKFKGGRRIIFVCLIVALVALTVFIFYKSKIENIDIVETNDIENEVLLKVIKEMEAEYGPRIGKTPSEDEIYNSPYIRHIRLALNGYLSGTNIGVEEAALNGNNDETNCGLNNFNKSYYSSKFIIFSASDNDYGGVQANMVFIDKPDTLFWAWIYLFGAGEGEYVLRAFCENPLLEEKKAEFKIYIDEKIKNSEYFL